MKAAKDDRVPEDLTCREQMRIFKALGEQGIKAEELLRIEKDNTYAKKVADYMRSGGRELSLDYKMAKAIMHQNFFGLEEWERWFGVKPTKRMLKASVNFPWSAEVLNSPCPFNNDEKKLVRDTHIVFLGLDMLDVRRPLKPRRLADHYSLIGSVHFAIQPDRLTKQVCNLRWYLMPMRPYLWVGGSDDWKSRLNKLPSDYEQSYFVEEFAKAMLLRAHGLSSLDDSVSYGCKDQLDHGQVAELCVVSPMPQAGPDLKLLPTWPEHRRSSAAGDNRPSSPPFAVGVSRKLPS